MTNPARPPAFALAWPRRRIVWLGSTLIAAIAALAVYGIVRTYHEAITQAERELDVQARVIAEHTTRSLQAVDTVLRHLAEQHQRGLLQRLRPEDLHTYLKEQVVGLVQVDGLVLAGPDGRGLGSSLVPPSQVQRIDLNKVDGYQRLQEDRSVRTLVGIPGRSLTNGHWVIPIGRRLEGPNGEFAGSVGASGRVEYFQQFYRAAYPQADTRIALLHRDARLMARHPPSDETLGRAFPLAAEWFAKSDAGVTVSRGISPLDGIDQFVAIRPVPDHPILILVARDAAEVLAPWRKQALGSAARTLALGALAAFLLILAIRQLDRLKAARDSLALSEQRYALAMTGSDEGHWLWDIPAGQIYISARQAEIFGLDGGAQTMRDTDYFERLPFHPDDRARVHAARNLHLAGGSPRLDHEYRIVLPDTGDVRWVHTRAQCFRDDAGQPTRMAGATVDVTSRKRAEAALIETQHRFATAIAGSDNGIWEWDFAKGLAFGSSRGRELLGLPLQPELQTLEAQAAEMADQVHPDDRARRAKAIEDHLAGRADAYVVDYRARRPNDGWHWVHVHGRCERDAEGKPLRMAGSLSDIDARKRAEEALRQSEERYALAMAGSSGGYWVWNTVTDELFVSDKVNELMGQPPGQSQTGTRAEFFSRVTVHPDDVDHFRAVGADVKSGRLQRADYEYRIVLPPPVGERWILTRAQRFEGGDLRVAGVTVDITERKRAELERQRLEGQLRQAQKLEAIGTLAGGIAHDFNNILSAILGYGELAQRSAPEGSPIRRHIDATMAAGQRARSLVERILAFSRSGMGERVPVHVHTVVEEALDAVAGSLPPGITLVRALEAGDAGVLGDPTQIHQVVMNLCANAVQAMRREGRLEVRLRRNHLAETLAVATSTLPPGDYLELAVADTGSGIAPELLSRIFDPFFTTKEVGVGTGLGLSLVHGIVTDLGGGIAVESRPGEGTCFTVYLPAQSGVAAPAPPGSDETPGGAGQVVMLVDDEEALVRLGEEALAEIGYEPVGFTSPADALDALRADPSRFDLLMTDESMPGMTGTELARAARALRPDLPVVLASGYVTPAMAAQARAAGVDEVLSKPLTPSEVAAALAGVLRGLNTTGK